jgi:hypothetical protein
VLSDPLEVLSARASCCQCRARRTANSLGRLLIKVRVRLAEFDGEEGLDADVQVEGFTGPAGSDGAGIGMLKAVHPGEPITAGLLLLPAVREIKMPGQVFIAEPRITRPAIGLAEQPTISITANGDPALMNSGVMPLTQQHQIVEIGAATQNPRN